MKDGFTIPDPFSLSPKQLIYLLKHFSQQAGAEGKNSTGLRFQKLADYIGEVLQAIIDGQKPQFKPGQTVRLTGIVPLLDDKKLVEPLEPGDTRVVAEVRYIGTGKFRLVLMGKTKQQTNPLAMYDPERFERIGNVSIIF